MTDTYDAFDDMMLTARTANMAAQDADPEEVSRAIELGDASGPAYRKALNCFEYRPGKSESRW